MRDTVATALTQSTAVHLAIPVDIQMAHIHAPQKALCSRGAGQRVHNHLPCETELVDLARLFAERMRDPEHAFIVAIGRRGVDAASDILALARLLHAPIVTMLDAKGSVPETDPLCVGCVSIFGNPGLEIPATLIERCSTVVSFGVDNHMTLLVGTDGLQLRQHIEFDYDSSLIETRFQARERTREKARERIRERERDIEKVVSPLTETRFQARLFPSLPSSTPSLLVLSPFHSFPPDFRPSPRLPPALPPLITAGAISPGTIDPSVLGLGGR